MAKPVQIAFPSDSNRVFMANPLSTGQIGQLTSPKNRGARGLTLLSDAIIPHCLRTLDDEPGIQRGEYKNMLAGDSEAVIVGLTRATFGDEFDYKIVCPECESKEAYFIRLDSFKMKPLPPGAQRQGLTFSYEYKGKTLTYVFHLPIVKDQITLASHEAQLKDQHPTLDFSLSLSLACIIDEIKGLSDALEGPAKFQAIHEHIYNLPGDFLHAFKEALEEVNCGLDQNIEHTCPACSKTFAADIPLLQGFFSRESQALRKARAAREKMKSDPSKASFGISC